MPTDICCRIFCGNNWGLTGSWRADGIAIDQLDIMTGNNIRSAALALKAGVDISLWDEGYTKLEEALNRDLSRKRNSIRRSFECSL